MAISRLTGQEYTHTGSDVRPAGAQSLADVTIPATSEFAIIFFGFYDDALSGQHPTSVTLDGQAASLIVAEDSNNSNLMGALYYVATPSSGASKTLAWSNPSAYEDGVSIVITFLTGGDLSAAPGSLVRSSGSANGASGATTASLAANSGDYAINGAFADTTPATFSPATGYVTTGGGSAAEHAPTGSTAYGGTGTSMAICAAVLIPAGAAGLLVPADTRRRFFFRGARR